MPDPIIRLTDTPRWTEVFRDPELDVACFTGALPADGAAFADAYLLGLVRSGTLGLAGAARRAEAGEVFVLEPGQAAGWAPSDGASAFVLARRDDAAPAKKGPGAVVAAGDLPRPLPASTPTPAHLLIDGDPKQGDLVLAADASGEWNAGSWETTPYHRVTTRFPKHELMHLLDGWLELGEEDGPTHRFEAGDSFLVTRGVLCDWKTGGLRKFYATFTPKG